MSIAIGQNISQLDTPQLLVDLDVVDANVRYLQKALENKPINIRVHFKSLKCTGLAKYLTTLGIKNFLCAKLNEAEALVAAGLTDVLIANQIVGEIKMQRLAHLAGQGKISVCVDHADNVHELSKAMSSAGVTLGVLVEVDTGMNRCGVEPGAPALALARQIAAAPGLKFVGLQGYDGHLQLIMDANERREKSDASTKLLLDTRKLIEDAGLAVEVVTGAGTGTWEFVSKWPGVTEIQPGSFILMDAAYNQIRPEFSCSLSILTQVISKRSEWYVLDAGSKAISKDFGMPRIKGNDNEQVSKLAEEHTIVECPTDGIAIGVRRQVLPAHCCATMNLHRQCVAVRNGKVEAVWPIEASGRYD